MGETSFSHSSTRLHTRRVPSFNIRQLSSLTNVFCIFVPGCKEITCFDMQEKSVVCGSDWGLRCRGAGGAKCCDAGTYWVEGVKEVVFRIAFMRILFQPASSDPLGPPF